MTNKLHHTQNKGFALLLALIISSIALSIGLSMLHVTLKQLELGTTTKGSEVAFQAASAGMECLRYIRNDQSAKIFAGTPIEVKCLGGQPNISNSGSGVHNKYIDDEIDWTTAEGDLCIGIEMHLLDASAAQITYTFGSAGTKTCKLGDVCTFGFVRGYNRSCSDVGSSIFTVQRELTAEF